MGLSANMFLTFCADAEEGRAGRVMPPDAAALITIMILTIDIGTSFLKAALVNRDGKIVKIREERLKNRFSDITCTSVWENALSRVIPALELSDCEPECVIISGNGPTLAPSSGGKVFLYTFGGAKEESAEIRKKLSVELSPAMFLPKALYIRNKEPLLWKNSDFFMSSPEYMSYKLTGEARTVLSLEGLERWYWNEDMLDALGLEKSKFPPFIGSGEFLGKVTRESAQTFGIKEGTPVLAGAPDFVPAIIGSGAMHEGMVCNRSGSSEGINYCSAVRTEEPYYMCYRHPNNVNWNVSAVIPRGFIQIDSAKDALGFSGMSYTELFEHIETHDDPASLGMREACRILCLEIKTLMDRIAGGVVSEIRLSGAPGKYGYFNQLRANITGVRVSTIDSPECGLLGLAVMALSALNKENIVSTADRMVKVKETFYPEG